MEPQLFKMLTDRFNAQDEMLQEISALITEHVKKDEHYWKAIDDLRAQGRLIKIIGGSSIGTAVGAWLWHNMGLRLW